MCVHRLVIAGLCVGLLLPQAARSEDATLLPPALGVSEVFASDQASGLALAGVDPVSFSLDRGPRPGLAALTLVWAGHLWRFASEANRQAFARDPAGFAPRIGGYDAARMAEGVRVAADPRHHLLRDGGLYLFRSDASRARFLADGGLQAKAEAEWLRASPGLVRD